MSQLIRRFLKGFFIPLSGLSLISSNRRVRKLALMPFFLTVVIIFVGVALSLPYCSKVIHFLIRWSLEQSSQYFSSGLMILQLLIEIVAWPLAFIFLVVAFFAISRVLALPFFTLLAERALIETKIRGERDFQFQAWLKVSMRLILVAVVKLGIFTILGVVLFLVSFVPGIGLFSVAGFLIMAAIDVVDISFDALEMTWRSRVWFVYNEFPAILGLAAGLGLVFFIPGLNFFLFPAAVAGTHVILSADGLASRDDKRSSMPSLRAWIG